MHSFPSLSDTFSPDSLRFATSPVVWYFHKSHSLRTMQLVRTLHLYCTMEIYVKGSPYKHLVQSLEYRIESVLSGPARSQRLSSDLHTLPRSSFKISALLRYPPRSILSWALSGEVTSTEFVSLYKQWRLSHGIDTLVGCWSAQDVDEIETWFVIEEGKGLFDETGLEGMVREVEKVGDELLKSGDLGVDHDLSPIPTPSTQWVRSTQFSKVHTIFSYLDEDAIGQLTPEHILWLMLSLMLPESAEDVEEESLRKQVARQLDQMRTTSGVATFHQFQVYLLYQGLYDEESLDVLSGRLQFISSLWHDIQPEVFPQGLSLPRHFPSLWSEAVASALSPDSFPTHDSLYKYLLLHGLHIAATPTLKTKGKTYICGTFIQFPIDLAVELYQSFLACAGEGFPHIPSDPRFSAILETVTKFSANSKLVVSKIIAKCRSL